MANINKIKLSGTSYDIQDTNAARSVTLTQAEYDALQTKDPNVFYIISDSNVGYVTSAETQSAITQAVSGKADSSSVYLKSETSGATEISTALNDKLDATAYTPTDLSNYYTTAQTDTKISQAVSGKTNQSDFSGHTANTTVHVTAQDKTNWNNKSDFSGSYNDLTDKPTIPTVPTSNTAFTNDAGYITSSALNGYATTGDVQTATNDMATKTWVGQQGYLTEHQSLTAYSTTEQVNTAISQATSGKTNNTDFTAHTANTTVHVTAQDKTNWNAKSDFSGSYNDLTNKLSAGTNITIVDNVINASGGGSITIDPSLDSGSTNAVANSAITNGFNTYTLKRNSDNGEVRYFYVSSPSQPYGGGGQMFFNFSINGRCPLTQSNGTNNYIDKFSLVETSAFTAHTADTTIHVTTAQTASWDGAVSDISTISGNVSTISGDVASLSGDVATVSGAIPSTYVSSIAPDSDGGYQRFYRFSTPSNFNYFLLNNAKINNRAILSTNWGGFDTNFSLVETSAITTSVTSSSTDSQVPSAKAVNDKLGGLSIVKLTQSEYDALSPDYDANTLYIVTDS